MANFLIHPLSLMASQLLNDLNHDIERQEALDKGKDFPRHACSLDTQIRVRDMSLEERSALIGELTSVFLKYVQHPDKSLARVALKYLNLLVCGSFEESRADSEIVSETVTSIRETYAKAHPA